MLGTVELRQEENGPATLRGRFPYGATATVKNRGRVRKERMAPRAFRFAIDDTDREINLLVGHSYDKPLASRSAGTLDIRDGDDAVKFRATLPDDAEQPSWMRDALLSVRAGLMSGVSPGFMVPPRDVVPNAQRLVPEPGNESVMIRGIAEAVLLEMSLVTRPAYPETAIEARAWREIMGPAQPRRRVWL